jgi:hypothetical protein
MNQDLLMNSANELDKLLRQYAEFDDEAKTMLRVLTPLIQDARSGKIITPVESRNIPGTRNYLEGNLQQYRDFDDAYGRFILEVTGGETPARREIREKFEERRKARENSISPPL